LEKAREHYRHGRFQQAEALYREVLARAPQTAEAQGELGLLFLRQGKFPEAEACFRKAIQLRPQAVQWICNMALALQNMGRLEEAIVCCQEAIRLKPDFAEAHNTLGIFYCTRGI
jgi:Flp pilus assembly protein TadD